MPNINENVKVELFAFGKGNKTRDMKAASTIISVVKKDVLPKDNVEYYNVKVKVKNNKEGKPEYLILYKLRKDSYLAEVSKVKVDKNYQVEEIENDYNDEDDQEEVEEEKKDITYETYDFVFSTPVPEFTTARNAVNALYNIAIAAGYRAKKLFGSEATVADYKHYLTSGLKGFVNIGHGNPSLIVLHDGRLDASWFNSLSGNALNPTVVYFNSCQVFNPPLQPSVMHSGARTYVGGILSLSVGPSEEVCKCFWHDILANGKRMGDALRDCEATHYHTINAHGISGDLGRFRQLPQIRPTWNPSCMVVRPTRNPRDPRCMVPRPTLDPSCMVRPTLKCPVRPTLTCGPHIPDMPHRFEYYDPEAWYNDDEMWYEDDVYDYWDIDDNEEE